MSMTVRVEISRDILENIKNIENMEKIRFFSIFYIYTVNHKNVAVHR